ncbi:MAG: aminoacyl-tRNA hydrolase [Pedosphaera sp.]|nr:aminoacyl-tRNA hydrolase [Pedosphaera sp.]
MDDWHLIVGLGNPGAQYATTRHNAGFMAVEMLARRWRADWVDEKKFSARVARATVGDRRVLLCQPQTFMNVSGEAVGPLADYYKIGLDHLLIVVDDANLALGEVRLRPDGSSGGHHGIGSVEMHMASAGFARQRVGIGRPAMGASLTPHVLGAFAPGEMLLLGRVLERTAEQAQCWLSDGLDTAMNQFNGQVS